MNGIHLIYHFQASHRQNEEFRGASYKIISSFNEAGMIDPVHMLEILKSFPLSNVQEGTFLSLDELKAFASRVGEEFQASEVRLISVQDYNIGVDGAKDIKSFREIFSKYGELILSQSQSKKKNFFGKLFS
jgi:hypothetical protein